MGPTPWALSAECELMTITAPFTSAAAAAPAAPAACWRSAAAPLRRLRPSPPPPTPHRRSLRPLRVVDGSERAEVSPDRIDERSESDKLVDSMNFGELCNDFECISSPLVESTARQLARDIFELREGNRALGSYFSLVKYKDPVRTFVGREKYKRPLWATVALEKPSVTVQEMVMLSTSVLSIKWTLRGKPKFPASIGGDLILRVTSRFSLNQISGQVLEHEELWDLSASSAITRGYFWISRYLFSATETGKDTIDSIKKVTTRFSGENENLEIYPDPSGDPRKFFQADDSLQRDAYQIALFLAVVYLIVQFLRTTL